MRSKHSRTTSNAIRVPTAPVIQEGDRILGDHALAAHPFGDLLVARDGATASKAFHRALAEKDGSRELVVEALQTMLVNHHVSQEALKRTTSLREAMRRLGLEAEQAKLRRFPTNASTQKGNLAEIVLAEYIRSASGLVLTVYRLHYNPNVDQSMKGDDVLAFDLDANPPRIVVGEAKFRGASSAAAVKEIVAGLLRSYEGGLPASLQFVADRLFDAGEADLGTKVMNCAKLFVFGELRIDYVGMLMSDTKSAERVNDATPGALRRLAMISFGVKDPDALVTACYAKLE